MRPPSGKSEAPIQPVLQLVASSGSVGFCPTPPMASPGAQSRYSSSSGGCSRGASPPGTTERRSINFNIGVGPPNSGVAHPPNSATANPGSSAVTSKAGSISPPTSKAGTPPTEVGRSLQHRQLAASVSNESPTKSSSWGDHRSVILPQKQFATSQSNESPTAKHESANAGLGATEGRIVSTKFTVLANVSKYLTLN